MTSLTESPEQIESRAADWILLRDRGAMTDERRRELEMWLSADSRHRQTYLKLNEAWHLSSGFKTWRPVDGAIDLNVLTKTLPAPRHYWSARTLALAASVLLAVTAAVYFWSQSASGQLYTTEIGGYQRVLLDDGSVIQLNTDTHVKVRFTDNARSVQLLRGEAYFTVARDAQRPFEVSAAGKSVRALGTAFTVRMRDHNAVEVVVTDGQVAISSAQSAAKVSAGQTAKTNAGSVRVSSIAKEALKRQLAWQSGELRFQDESLSEVVAEFNRYNRRRMEVLDPELAAVKVGGNFKPNDLDSFMVAMHEALGIEAEVMKDVIRLKPSTP